jgi:toxin ParE1/3/4
VSEPVRFAPHAEDDLSELFDYIAAAASPEIAGRYVDELIAYCETLATFPQGGTLRDDIRPGLRTTGFRGRVVIAFATIDDTVVVLGIYYGGRDYETLLTEPSE